MSCQYVLECQSVVSFLPYLFMTPDEAAFHPQFKVSSRTVNNKHKILLY